MQKHTKLTVLATLGTVALGATLIGAAPALAAGNGNSYERGSLRAELSQTADVGSCACANYVDADGNGMCDSCGHAAGHAHRGCANYVDVDGDGICSSRGSGNGAGFVDADGDGICDNRGSGAGNSAGYVDANDDGVCDNYGTSSGVRRGNGSGCADADGDGICDNYGSGTGGGHHSRHGGDHHGGGRGHC